MRVQYDGIIKHLTSTSVTLSSQIAVLLLLNPLIHALPPPSPPTERGAAVAGMGGEELPLDVGPEVAMVRPLEEGEEIKRGGDPLSYQYDSPDYGNYGYDDDEIADYLDAASAHQERLEPELDHNSSGGDMSKEELELFLSQFYLIKTPDGYILGRSLPTHTF